MAGEAPGAPGWPRAARGRCSNPTLSLPASPCRLPGSDTPAYLENLPASYGFDPLGLGELRRGPAGVT